MYYEKDYIMNLINEIVKVLKILILGKDINIDLSSEISNPIDVVFYEIAIKLADKGKIKDAETLLLSKIKLNDLNQMPLIIMFYEHINNYPDEFFIKYKYERNDILIELKKIVLEYGIDIYN